MNATVDSSVLQHSDPTQASTCANCGRTGDGGFCDVCGQKRFHPGDLSVGHAWHHLTHELLHLDGKIVHSLKLLFTRPGQLTVDFIEGRRARHTHPLRLFLTFLFLFFFFAPVNPLLDIGGIVSQQLLANPKVEQSLRARAERKGVALETVLSDTSNKMKSLSKPLDVALVGLNGVALWLLFRKRRPYLAESMTMQLHVASFNMAIQLTLGWFRVVPSLRTLTGILIGAISVVYFVLAARRVYGEGWLSVLLKYIALLALQFVVVFATITAVFVGDLSAALS